MRILHVGLFLHLGSGHRAQLDYERRSIEALAASGTHWETHTIVPAPDGDAIVLPPWAKRFQLSKLYLWQHIRRHASDYDFVLMRSVSPDPFAPFFAARVPNLLTVHHTKEPKEIALLTNGPRRALSLILEGPLKSWAFRRLRGIVGVTGEIADYERVRFPNASIVATYPNGINAEELPSPTSTPIRTGVLEAVFVASEFYDWHGVDRVFDALEREASTPSSVRIRVHLVGGLNDAQLARALPLQAAGHVAVHGNLSSPNLDAVLAKSQVAIASLALDRTDLSEACTLKVREYLVAGLPVYSTHKDSGFPDDFPFYMVDESGFNIDRLEAFAWRNQDVPRSEIRAQSLQYINKQRIMERLVEQLRTPPSRRALSRTAR